MVSRALIPLYAEYLEAPAVMDAGICTDDACVVFKDAHPPAGCGGGLLIQVPKSPLNNIYEYLSHRITDTVLASTEKRVYAFLAQTFWRHRESLNCTFCGLALALMSRTVDRAFWTLERGGVGQSLFTTLIESAISPNRAYIDCDVLYHDEDIRKKLPILAPYIFWTSQEVKEGGNRGV